MVLMGWTLVKHEHAARRDGQNITGTEGFTV